MGPRTQYTLATSHHSLLEQASIATQSRHTVLGRLGQWVNPKQWMICLGYIFFDGARKIYMKSFLRHVVLSQFLGILTLTIKLIRFEAGLRLLKLILNAFVSAI